MKSSRSNQSYTTMSAKYGPLETENDRVGTANAESPEAEEDDHGMKAARAKRKRGGKVEGKKPRVRMDRPSRKHPDEAEDRQLIKKMVRPDDLKPERARGGSVKSKKGTTVNVIIAPQGGSPKPGMPMPAPGMPPQGLPMPPVHPPVPASPLGGPTGMPVGVPSGPPGVGVPPGVMRKSGGRVYHAGAGSGEGRQEKEKAYGKKAFEGEK